MDSWNGTGLIRAAERGHALVVGQLFQAGIDRDHTNRIIYQAHEAVWFGANTPVYVDTVRVLGAGGAALTTPSRSERLTPCRWPGSAVSRCWRPPRIPDCGYRLKPLTAELTV